MTSRNISPAASPSVNGQVLAVDQLSFTVKPGEVVGFLGPNGAARYWIVTSIAR